MWPWCARRLRPSAWPCPGPVRVFADADPGDAPVVSESLHNAPERHGDVIEVPAESHDRSVPITMEAYSNLNFLRMSMAARRCWICAESMAWPALGAWGAHWHSSRTIADDAAVLVVGTRPGQRWRKSWSPVVELRPFLDAADMPWAETWFVYNPTDDKQIKAEFWQDPTAFAKINKQNGLEED